MKITTKTTRDALIARVRELEADAADMFHEITLTRGKLNAAVNRMGDNKPWKLIVLAFVAGIAATLALGAVF